MTKAMDIARYIANVIEVDEIKLQKLLFYTQAVCLVRFDKPAFTESIEAWDYGPVVPAVYHKLKRREGAIKLPAVDYSGID